MSKSEGIYDFIHRIVKDQRMTPSHLSLCIALCHLWAEADFGEYYFITRRKVMVLAHIYSIATYHKVIKDLVAFGYIEYHPSYHPIEGSSVRIIIQSYSSIIYRMAS